MGNYTYPENRYMTDPEFHALVDWMESAIHKAAYTPSEMRTAALLASIHYEQHAPAKIPNIKQGEERI